MCNTVGIQWLCHLYENVQNRPQNKKKFDGVRKWVSEMGLREFIYEHKQPH